jgi:coenzyme F420 hydrogenase subunit delta
MIEHILKKPIIILGCGNVLFGDDGFGPAVIEYLEAHYRLPETVWIQDMGTSIQEFIFDLLISPSRPKRIFIIDALSQPGRGAGELFEIDLAQLPEGKISGRPAHQFPSIGKLQELMTLTGVDIRILVVQTREIPEMVRPGLSMEVKGAIPRACDWLVKEIGLEKI